MSDIKYEIVKGCEKLGYYDIKITKDVKIRFFQIAQFQENGLYAIRSYLFEGNGTNTGCFYEYKPVEMNDYKINKRELNRFVKTLRNKKDSNTYKIIFKYYPVYSHEFSPMPSGNELNQCNSELLKTI